MIHARTLGKTMSHIKVELPGVHMAGSNAHHNAHLEVGQHGFALFLAPDAEYPVLDVNGTSEQLDVVVRELQAALAASRALGTDTHDRAPMNLTSQARSSPVATMRHTLYEDPVTHKFALIRLPNTFADGDAVPLLPTDRWFSTREEALAALPDLFNQDE